MLADTYHLAEAFASRLDTTPSGSFPDEVMLPIYRYFDRDPGHRKAIAEEIKARPCPKCGSALYWHSLNYRWQCSQGTCKARFKPEELNAR